MCMDFSPVTSVEKRNFFINLQTSTAGLALVSKVQSQDASLGSHACAILSDCAPNLDLAKAVKTSWKTSRLYPI